MVSLQYYFAQFKLTSSTSFSNCSINLSSQQHPFRSIMRSHKKPTPTRQSLSQQINESKQQIKRLTERKRMLQNEILDIKEKIRWAFEVTISLIVNYNQTFVSQYTILYKSYMILTAFLLTIVGNYLWVGQGHSMQYQQGESHLMIQHSQSFLADRFHPQSLLYTITYILPLRGRFSLLFFQLMLLTTIQILYQFCIQLHFRYKAFIYNRNKSKQQQQSYQNQRSEYLKQVDLLSKYTKAKIEEERQPGRYDQELEEMAMRVGANVNTNTTSATNKSQSSSSSKTPTQDNILTPLKFLIQNCKEMNGCKLLFETKFLYLFALMYSETALWEGVVRFRWRQRYVHLFIIFSCLMEFLIWALINVVLEATEEVKFGSDKTFVLLGNSGEIDLVRY